MEETFEKRLERLEKVVGEMEDKNITLEKMLAAYEEGIKLARGLEKELCDAEKRIQILVEKNDTLELTEYGGQQ